METPSHTRRARRLRRESTLLEKRAWAVLRLFRDHGFTIRRQHPIAGLTVDFACRPAKLAIEIDGPLHRIDAIRLEDHERDKRLRAAGWNVLRLSDEDTLDPDHLFCIVAERLGLDFNTATLIPDPSP